MLSRLQEYTKEASYEYYVLAARSMSNVKYGVSLNNSIIMESCAAPCDMLAEKVLYCMC